MKLFPGYSRAIKKDSNRFSVFGFQFPVHQSSVNQFTSKTEKLKTGKLIAGNRQLKTDNWKKAILVSVLVLFGYTSVASAATGINRQINFQGKVVNKTSGTNVTNGNYNFTFRLYDAASNGNLIWTENFNATNSNQLTVTDGIFRATLGSVCSFSGGSCQGNTNSAVDFGTDNLYLDITFNGETMGSRVRFTASPYAFYAEKVAGLSFENNESISNGTDGVIFLGRNDSGTVTLSAKDDDSTAAFIIKPGGAASLTLGDSSTTGLTVVTDNTGNGEVVLPDGSISSAEFLDASLLPEDIQITGSATDEYCLTYESTGTQFEWQTCSAGTNYLQLNSGTLAPGGLATASDRLVLGGNTSTLHQFEVNGRQMGKALVSLNETGDQDIFTASASGTPMFTVGRNGHASLGSGTTPDQSFGATANRSLLNIRGTMTSLTTNEAEGVYTELTLDPTGDNTTGVHGNYSKVSTTLGNAFNFDTVTGVSSTLLHYGEGIMNSGVGVSGTVSNMGEGTMLSAIGASFTINNFGDGTINDAYGAAIYAGNFFDGAINNMKGLYIADMSGVGSTSSYNLYSAGATAKNYFAGVLGIGETNPQYPLDIAKSSTSTTAGDERGMRIVLTDTGDVSSGFDTTYGQYIDVTRTGASGGSISTIGQYIGVTGDSNTQATGLQMVLSNAVVSTGIDLNISSNVADSTLLGYESTISSSGNVVDARAFVGSVVNNGAGTMFEAYGASFYLSQQSATGTINNGYGLYVDSANNNGTFNNNYGLYINDQSAVGSTNSYNLYSAGVTAKNYFAGVLGVGTDSTPEGLVDIEGARTGQALVQLNETGDQAVFTASVSGTTKFVITNTGNVGIGTNNPGTALVVESSAPQLTLRNDSSAYTTLGDSSGSLYINASNNIVSIDDNVQLTGGRTFKIFDSSPFSLLEMYQNGTLAYIGTNKSGLGSSTPLTFGINASEKMRIDTAGNVGIGTTGPASKLHVDGATMGKALVTFNETGNQNILVGSASGITKFVFDRNGTLQLTGGQTSDIDTLTNTTLNIGATNATTITLGRNSQAINLGSSSFANCTALETVSNVLTCGSDDGGAGSNYWQLNGGTLSPFALTADVNLGATATSSAKISLAGSLARGRAAAIFNQTESNQDVLAASVSGTTKFVISKDGNVGIGTSTPTSQLHLVNSGLSSGQLALFDATQTSVNTSDTNDMGLQISHTLSASSASNELVQRGLMVNMTNSLTGGGAISNLRGLTIKTNTSASTVTTALDNIYIENGTTSGTVQDSRGLLINGLQGTSRGGIAINTLNGTNNSYVILGQTSIPSGNFGIYNASTYNNYFAGNMGIGTSSPATKLHVSGATDGKALAIFNETGDQAILTASASGSTRFIVGRNGHLAVGSDATIDQDQGGPTASTLLNIRETVTDMSKDFVQGIYTSLTLDPTESTSNIAYGIGSNVQVSNASDKNFSELRGVSSSIIFSGSGSLSTVYGSKSFFNNLGSTSVGTNYGYYASMSNGSTRTISTNYGYYVDTPSNSGTVTSNYGLYINDQSSVGSTNSFNIYSAGATAKNYFAGLLEADGAVRFDSSSFTLGHANFANCTALETSSGVLTCGSDDGGVGGTNYWQLNSGVLSPFSLTAEMNLGATATASAKISLAGSLTRGKAVAIFNQTENQDILAASASGVTKFVISTAGEIYIPGSSVTGDITTLSSTTAKHISLVPARPTSAGDGGNINLNGGASLTSGHGGSINLNGAAAAGTDKNGGSITINSGAKNGTGTSTIDIGTSSVTNLSLGTASTLSSFTVGVAGWTSTNGSVLSLPGGFNAIGRVSGKALAILNETGNQDIFTASSSGNPVFTINNATNAVNGFQFIPAATSIGVTLQSAGTDANVGLSLLAKGSGTINIGSTGGNGPVYVGNGTTTTINLGYYNTIADINIGNSLTTGVINLGKTGIGTANGSNLLMPGGFLSSGVVTGKALAIFNETGDQNILAASSSGSKVFSVAKIPAAGTSGDIVSINPALTNMNGSDTVRGLYVNFTNGTHSGSSNVINGIDVGDISGSANATETALNIGTGWDKGIVIASGGSTNEGLSYTGAGRPTKTITLSPEFAGGIITASGSATTTGSMTSDASPSANFRTYYEWNASDATNLQDYTVAVRVKLPKDFSAWATSNAIQVDYNTEQSLVADNKFDVYIYNPTDSTSTPVYFKTNNVGATGKVWTTLTIDDSEIDDGVGPADWDAADETVLVYIRMYSRRDFYTQIGDITLNYLAKF